MSKTVQIYYFNDEHQPVKVKLSSGSDILTELKPADGAYFTIELPDHTVPFVKKWENMVFIGWIQDPKG